MAVMSDTSLLELLDYAPLAVLFLSFVAVITDLLIAQFGGRITLDDPYDPNPGTKWEYQQNPQLRNGLEPPPTDEMNEEVALFEASVSQEPWPAWYIDWDFRNNVWDWEKGWRRKGLPPLRKRQATAAGQRWYWQEDPADRRADEPPPTGEMNAEALLSTNQQAPWPPWYLESLFQESGSDPTWGWRDQWIRDGVQDMSKTRERKEPNWPVETDKSTAQTAFYSFLVVHFLVMMADWIQGPYVYAVYKELNISEDNIRSLYSADIYAAIVLIKISGPLTDLLGRKLACLTFCVLYFLNCCTIVISSCWEVHMWVLLVGRLFRGVAANILYSAFESWLSATHDSLKLWKRGYNIGRTFGYMTVLKGVSAFLADLISKEIVRATSYKIYTMVASATLFVFVFLLIAFSWADNYGAPTSYPSLSFKLPGWRLGTLHAVSIVFNLSLDVFTLFWARALQDPLPKVVLFPYGIVYATFLGCTVVGALIFNILISSKRVFNYNNALTAAILIGAASLTAPFFAGSNVVWSFAGLCLFRIAIGMISPAISQMKYNLVPNSSRAATYTEFHMPIYQSSHWISYFFERVFGIDPQEVTEKVFLYLSMLMAASGFGWFLISNNYQLFPPRVITPLVPPPAPLVPPPVTFMMKLNRIFQAVRSGLEFIRSLSIKYGIKLWKLPKIIGLCLSISALFTLIVVFGAVCWTISLPWKLHHWIWSGDHFPDLGLRVLPTTFGELGLPPLPLPLQDGNFRRFLVSLGYLVTACIHLTAISATLVSLAYGLFWILDQYLFDTHVSTNMTQILWVIWEWAMMLVENSASSAVDWTGRRLFDFGWLLGCTWAHLVDFFTTCTSMSIGATGWTISSLFGLCKEWFGISLAYIFRFFGSVLTPLKWVIRVLTPEDTLLGDIKDVVGNATNNISSSAYNATLGVQNYTLGVYNFTVDGLFNFTRSLIPVNISAKVEEFSEAACKILLKKPGWEGTFQKNQGVIVFVVMPITVLSLYLLPWHRIGKIAMFIQKLGSRFILGIVFYGGQVVTFAVIGPWNMLKRLSNATLTKIMVPISWIRNNGSRTFQSLPHAVKFVVGPMWHLSVFLLDWLGKALGALATFIGYLMVMIADRVSYVTSRPWEFLKIFCGIIVRYTTTIGTNLERFGHEVCRVWRAVARWFEDIGEKLWPRNTPPRPPTPPGPVT